MAEMFLVGGAIREIVRGSDRSKIKDWDFAVEAKSFSEMYVTVEDMDFEIFVESPQFATLTARAPRDSGFEFAGMDMSGKTFDFALCRTEGGYSDGRHPDEIGVGTIHDDLARRDFTMNAMAMDKDGKIIDPFNGQKFIKDGVIACVGKAKDRMAEDGLRMLRAVRFAVQLDFNLSAGINNFLRNPANMRYLENVSMDRIRDELTKAFKIDTPETLYYLYEFPYLAEKAFKGGLWLMPTTKRA